MYCHRCDKEYSARARFCKACGGNLEEREASQLLADLARTRFLLGELEKWQKKGLLANVVAEELARPYHKRVAAIEEAVAALKSAATSLALSEAPDAPAAGMAEGPSTSPAPSPVEGLEVTGARALEIQATTLAVAGGDERESVEEAKPLDMLEVTGGDSTTPLALGGAPDAPATGAEPEGPSTSPAPSPVEGLGVTGARALEIQAATLAVAGGDELESVEEAKPFDMLDVTGGDSTTPLALSRAPDAPATGAEPEGPSTSPAPSPVEGLGVTGVTGGDGLQSVDEAKLLDKLGATEARALEIPAPTLEATGGEVVLAVAAAMGEPVDVPEAPLTTEQALIERESPWHSFWRPFLYENIGWFVGAFLLLSGSFYFVAESQGTARTLLVTGLLGAYSCGFWWIGRHLAMSRGLTLAGRVLASISGAMAPMVVLAAGPLRVEHTGLWALVATACVVAMGLLVRACAKVFGARASGQFALAAWGLLVLFAVAPLARSALALATIDAIGIAILWLAVPLLGRLRDDKGHAAFAGVGLGWLALALLVRVHYQGLSAGAPLGIAHYGPLAAVLGTLVLRAERKLFAPRPTPSWLELLGYAAIVSACAASSSNRVSFAIACTLFAVSLAQGAARHRSSVFSFLAVLVGWLAYHAASGFFRADWLLAIVDGVKSVAGYAPGARLPWNYGGLASLGYLALLALVYRKAQASGAEYAQKALRLFAPGLAVVLLVWAHLGDDLRPAAATAAVVALLSLGASFWFGHPRLAYLAGAAVLALGGDLGLALRSDASAAQLGLALASLALVLLSRLTSDTREQSFFELALAGAAGALLLLVAGSGALGALAAGATAAACLAVSLFARSSLFAYPGLAVGVFAILRGLHLGGVPDRLLPWCAMGLGFAFLIASGARKSPTSGTEARRWFGAQMPLGARGWGALREPLAHVGRLATWAAIALASEFEPRAPALLAAAFALAGGALARRQSSAWRLYVPVLAAMVAVAIAAGERWGGPAIPLALSCLGLGFAALAVALARRQSFAAALLTLEPRKAALPFVFGASFAAVVGSLSSALLAIDGGEPASLTLAVAATTFFVLVRFNGSPWWLACASALGSCAIGFALPSSALPLMLVLVAHAHFGFVLLDRRAPALARAVFGVERSGFALGIFAHLHAAAAVLTAAILVELGEVRAAALAVPAAALFAFYALAPRVDRRAGWLGAALVAGWAALALPSDARHAFLLLALCGVAGALLGALARRFPRAAERCVLASLPAVSYVLAGTGLALAATAGISVLGEWPAIELHAPLVLGCAGLAFFLAPRSFPTPFLLVPAAVAAVLAVGGALPKLSHPLLLALFAVALSTLGAVFRNAPGATRRVFACDSKPTAQVLTGTGLAAALIAAMTMPLSANLSACAALVGVALAIAPRVFPTALLLGPAAASALVAIDAESGAAHRALAIVLGALAVAGCAVLLRRFPRLGRLLFGLDEEQAPLCGQTLATTALVAAALAIAFQLVPPSGTPLALIVGVAAAIAALALVATGWQALIPITAATFVASLAVAPQRLETSFLAALAGINLLYWLTGPSPRSRFDALLSFLRAAGFPLDQDAEPSAESRARGLLLGTAVAGTAVALALLATLSLGRWVAFALGLDPALTAAMVAAQALTAWHQLRRRPSLLSWHMALLLLAIGLWMLGGREAWPYLAGLAAVALAGLEAALARELGPRLIRRLGIELERAGQRAVASILPPYLVAFAVLGIASTGLRPALLATPVSLGLATVAFGIRAAGGSRWSRHTLAGLLPVALHFALFHTGIRLSTGRPPATILPFLALAMVLAAMGVERLARRLESRPAQRNASRVALVYAALAAGEWFAGLALVRFGGAELAASTLAILGLTWFCVRRAQATGSRLLAYSGFAAFVALYLSLRVQTGLFGTAAERSDADTLAGLVFGFLFLGVHAAVKRLGLQALSEPARRFALLMPIAGALLLEPEPSLSGALLLFGIAAQLTALSAVENRGKVSGVLAAVAFNLALAMLWLRAGIGGAHDAQFYVIPAGATLIVLAHLFRQGIGALWQSRLRAVGVLGIYLSSVYPALTAFGHPSYALWCALLCVVGVAVGIALRVRAYLYLGTAFLVTCVLGNMIRFGLQHHQAGAAFLTALGLLVVGFMIFFSARREELLRKYRKVEALLAEWQ